MFKDLDIKINILPPINMSHNMNLYSNLNKSNKKRPDYFTKEGQSRIQQMREGFKFTPQEMPYIASTNVGMNSNSQCCQNICLTTSTSYSSVGRGSPY